jgi:hypothetical protein
VDIFSARKPRILNPLEKTITSAAAAAGKCNHDPSDTSASRTLLCSRCVHAAVDAELFAYFNLAGRFLQDLGCETPESHEQS